MTMSPRLERSRSASASIAVGLAVGWSLRPRRAAHGQDFCPEGLSRQRSEPSPHAKTIVGLL